MNSRNFLEPRKGEDIDYITLVYQVTFWVTSLCSSYRDLWIRLIKTIGGSKTDRDNDSYLPGGYI